MTDEIKNDAEAALNDTKKVISELESGGTWVRTNIAIVSALGTFVLGFLAGHYIHL